MSSLMKRDYLIVFILVGIIFGLLLMEQSASQKTRFSEFQEEFGPVEEIKHKRNCLYCSQPLVIPAGAEHLRHALLHPHLALLGWWYYYDGNTEKRLEVEQRVIQKRKENANEFNSKGL